MCSDLGSELEFGWLAAAELVPDAAIRNFGSKSLNMRSPCLDNELIHSISDKHQVDGFTISGGEPMLQAGELLELITNLCDISTDVLVYTGFSIEELKPADPSVKPAEIHCRTH